MKNDAMHDPASVVLSPSGRVSLPPLELRGAGERAPPSAPGGQAPAWRAPLSAAVMVAVTWIACGLIGFALRSLGTAYACHALPGSGDPCSLLGMDFGSGIYSVAVGLLLIAGFGTPLFLFAIFGLLGFAIFKFALDAAGRTRD
jgi:hypothetical protein